jgi:glycosyltransferase involved in cell wall biosynthesis
MPSKLRLTYAIQYFDQTGPMRAPYQICKAFAQQGWQVDIQTMAGPGNAEITMAWEGVPIHKTAGFQRQMTLIKLALTMVRKRRQHIVLSFVWDWHCYGLLLAKWLFGSPYALVLDTYAHRSGQTRRRRLREMLRYEPLLRSADMILAESPTAYASAKRYTRKPVVVQVPFCLWQRELEAVERHWVEAGVQPQREKVILYAGRLVERKRVHDLITAFAQVAGDFPDWTLEIRGLPASEAYGTRLDALIAQSGCAEKIRFLPGLSGDSLYRRYRETAVFALPSEGEGMPTAITEAMYFGGAIVAGDSGAVSYQLDNGRCGLLHPPGDLDTLIGHLQTFMASSELRETYQARARQRMLDLFIWERYFPDLEGTFRQVVRG